MLQRKKEMISYSPNAVSVFKKKKGEGIANKRDRNPEYNKNLVLKRIRVYVEQNIIKKQSKILGTGVSLYEYMGRHSTHGKSLIIDDDIAVVGSYNFDCRSTYVDTETMLVVQGKEITKQLEEDFSRLKTDL